MRQFMTTRPPTSVPNAGVELGESGSIFPRPKAKRSLATLLAYPLIFGEPDGNVLAKENQWVAVPNLPVGGD